MTDRIDISLLAPSGTVTDTIASVAGACARGFSTFWSTQGPTVDALSALAIAGGTMPAIDLGTAVVPIQGRHPMVMAQQALTVNAHLAGRLILGLGVSHEPFITETWGMSYEHPVDQMAEYLDILLPLLAGDTVDYDGTHWTMHGSIETVGRRPEIYLSALGPRMVELAGRRADGVITWLVGPKSLETVTVPTMATAAADTDRPLPELIVGFPVCVTNDVDGARKRAAVQYGGHGRLPTYVETLRREGVEGPEDLAIVGNRVEVAEQIVALAELGATGLMADVYGSAAEREATLDALAHFNGSVVDLRDFGHSETALPSGS